MKMENFLPAIKELPQSLGADAADAHRAAVAITTTGKQRSGWSQILE
jgi:glutamate N-acetyltransferase/amino-acid N-acetyltransferase